MSEHIDGVLEHKNLVGAYMQAVSDDLFQRAVVHDYSKFSPEEFDAFERVTSQLKTLEYGSKAYKDALQEIKPALQYHYKVNRHHPEYFEDGVNDMNLMDVVEMVCDWCAAVQRVKDGDIYKSLIINKERFGISDQLYGIIKNTVDTLLDLQEKPHGSKETATEQTTSETAEGTN